MKFLLAHTVLTSLVLPAFAQNTFPNVSLQVAPPITLAAGATPSDVAVADFNQDSRPDVAVSERGLNRVSVYLQAASGFSAAASSTYPAGRSPSSLVALALDNLNTGQGLSDDLLVVSGPDAQILPLFNSWTTPGTFTIGPKSDFGYYQTVVSPRLATGVLSSSGRQDVAVIYNSPILPFVGSLRWNASIDQLEQQTKAELLEASSMTLADMDLDGDIEGIFTRPRVNSVRVFEHTGAYGSFWQYAYTDVPSGGTNPQSVAAGDVNSDQYPDLAVANAGSNTVVYYLRTGPFQYTTPVTIYLPSSPRHILLTDLSGDRASDLVVATDTQLLVYQNTRQTGLARFTTPTIFPLGGGADALRLAWVNGDGYPDLLVPCAADHTVRIFYNTTYQVTSGTRATEQLQVSLAPNPATNVLTVRNLAEKGPLMLTLLDGLGRQVLHQQIKTAETNVSVAELPRGLYLARLQTATGNMTQRIVLE